jgi:hypothetical protein
MAIPRVAYFAQTGVITTATASYLLPISSANIEVTRPIEAVTSFGQFNSLNTAQTNLTTCKSSFKTYLGSGNGGLSGLSAAAINDIIGSTQSGVQCTISVGPNGFSMQGILSNLGMDISMGGFGMADFSFAGVGNPAQIVGPTNTLSAISTGYSIAPITTMSIGTGSNGGALSGVYANSIKFSYDLPTDVLSALGDNPNALQANMVSQIATKAPYKSTITIEGHGVDPTTLDSSIAGLAYNIGNISITLPHAKVNARSFNNAAGQVSASYSYTAEDTAATFGAVSLAAYAYGTSAMGNTPSYGA